MSRHPRAVVENVPLHIVQRGNNRHPCFFSRNDFLVYLAMLGDAATLSECQVHAYVLMTNHVHILASSSAMASPALMMKRIGERYAQYANRRYARSGTLWQGRFRSCLVESERYFLICQRYIEMNPVRASMVARPIDYEWSSFRSSAHGEVNQLVSPHPVYISLASNDVERQSRYRSLFGEEIPVSVIEQVRNATNGNAAFGSELFMEKLGLALGRKLTAKRIGKRAS